MRNQQGEIIKTFLHNHPGGVILSNDDKIMVTGEHGGTTIKIWDLESGQEINSLETECTWRLVISSDGKMLAANSSNKIKIWSIHNNYEYIATLESHSRYIRGI